MNERILSGTGGLRASGLRPFLWAGLCSLFLSCREPTPPADLVLLNGKIVTLDEAVPQAQALAAREGRIVALGTDSEIRRFVGPQTRVLDLEGALAVPGLIDSHLHFMGVGEARLQLDLTRAANWDEIVAMVAQAAAESPPGTLIRGRGWHQEKWDRTPQPNVEGFPVHDALSAVSPEHPVILVHASGHATFANARAMAMAGITARTPDPPGGQILRDARGRPIGVFREEADALLDPVREQATPPDPRKVAELAAQELLRNGITTAHDAGVGFATVDLYRALADEGKLGVRLHVWLNAPNDELRARLPSYRLVGYGDHHLTVRTIKRLADGALGSRGAWLLEPYSDLPGHVGLNTTPMADIEETARIAAEHGFQLAVHAIGDRANREVLDLYERSFRAYPDRTDWRWRIEHAQHLHPADIPRFGQLGVIASMQAVHCTSDAPFVLPRLGENRAREGAYVWRSLMDGGAVIANGTDAPVEPVDAMAGFYAFVTRRPADGKAFFPEQALTRLEALRAYTVNGAYAGFEEDVKGTLTPGKLADITVLSKDILTVPEEEIPHTRVLYTIVGGQVRFDGTNR